MRLIYTGIILLSTFSIHAQQWCDAGANWKYSYFNLAFEGYTEINYTGDTTINGISARKLEKQLHGYDFVTSQYIDFDLGAEYTHEDNGLVLLWFNNDWDTLYNFNAELGDSWRMAKQPMLNACDSNSILTVTATGTKSINSTTLKYLVVDFSFPFGFSDTIVEKIGFISSYMFPYDFCDGALDGHEGGAFRCYHDNNFTTYKPHFMGECDYILGIENPSLHIVNRLAPNPASKKIQITGDLAPNAVLKIKSVNGKEWSVLKYQNTIDISGLSNGIYILSISQHNMITHHRFMVE